MSKILFINTIHNTFDDRTFFHHALSLSKCDVEVAIFSTLETTKGIKDRIQLLSTEIQHESKLKQVNLIIQTINQFQPSTVICDSPLGVIASSVSKTKKNIIYDVTEWVPSKKNLKNTKSILIPIKFTALLILNMVAGLLTNKFIFGEKYKSKLFQIFFWKKSIISSYYPDLNYLNPAPARDISENVVLYYSGWFNTEKGFDNVLKLTEILAKLQPTKNITLKLTGSYNNEQDKQHFESIINSMPQNVTFKVNPFKSFLAYCQELNTADIFLDLRVNDYENTHCLPIKLFYYLACWRPVVYSNLRAIDKVLNLTEVGFTYHNNFEQLAQNISNYMNNSSIYLEHCTKAKQLSQDKFNWKTIETDFLSFVTERNAKEMIV